MPSYFVKWKGLSYSECTWEPVEDLQDPNDKLKIEVIVAKVVKILIFPGYLIQKLTTKRPDEKQLEVAVASFKKHF